MKRVYHRTGQLKDSSPQPMGQWFQQHNQPANTMPNSFRIFPIEHYEQDMWHLKAKVIPTKQTHRKLDQFESYYSLTEKSHKIEVPISSRKRPSLAERKYNGKSLSSATCNKFLLSSDDSPQTPYVQRKIHRARGRLEEQINRKINYSTPDVGEGEIIQIAHAVKLHSMEINDQHNSNFGFSPGRNYRSSQSKCRSKVLHGVKYSQKVVDCFKTAGRKDNLRPWSGNVCGLGLVNEENYFLYSTPE